MRRISVIGVSGSGKTTLSRQISERTGFPHLELDSLVHQANWVELQTEELRRRVAEHVALDGWVVDGNYSSRVQDLVWGRADTVVWLDLPRRTILPSLLLRTLRRGHRGRPGRPGVGTPDLRAAADARRRARVPPWSGGALIEADVHLGLTVGQIALAAVTVALLLGRSAPYGRHTRPGWGPTIPSRLAWILMEAPAVWWFTAVFFAGDHALTAIPLLFLALWQVHYVHRGVIYPLRQHQAGKRMPVFVAALAFGFQTLNGYINARWISHLGDYGAWATDPRLWLGLGIFAVGFAINLHADSVLLHLRKPGETGYVIPTGGLYRWVSCPNYLGEIVEWIGWAVMTWSLPGLAFAVYTVANVGPRAWQNHRWYQQTFPDYPRRRALVPFVW